MRTLLITTAITLSAAFASANQDVNLKKVNKVIETAIQSELTPVINKLEVKIDERSKISSVEKLTAAASFSATAAKSAWSESATTLDVNAKLKTVHTDAETTKLQGIASVGSKTEAVKLYAFAAGKIAASMEQTPPEDELDKEALAFFKEASQTVQLDQVPAQFTQLVALIKKAVSQQSEGSEWDTLLNSLVVQPKVLNGKTSEVALKTTAVVDAGFVVVNELALTMNEKGIKLTADVTGTVETQTVVQMLASINEVLKNIELASDETVAELKQMAKGYIEMAEAVITDKE